jgi:propionyl-CoA synthetase
MGKYQEVWERSIKDPEGYWGEAAEKLYWKKKWTKVLDKSKEPFYRWFVGGETNLCYNAVDRHLPKKADQPAIIWESPETNSRKTYTFKELHQEINRFATVLQQLGVKKGDRIIIYLPMVPESIVAVLACVRIGAIHSVVFAGFSYEALADRINDAKPRLLICAEAGKRKGKEVRLKDIVDRALEAAEFKTEKVIVLDRGIATWKKVDGRDLLWSELMAKVPLDAKVEPVWLESSEPSYILYTSGTTGKPKGVVRDTGGYMVALSDSMEKIYGIKDGDVYWSTSDIGWVVGHSYIIYGPLIAGVPTVMFEGTPDNPNPGIWWEVVERYKVNVVFSAPTAFRMLRKFPEKWFKDHDLSSLRYLFLAGEPLDEYTYQWATSALGKPVIDHYWQTETGWAILGNHAGLELLPVKPGSPTKPCMGWQLQVVDEKGNQLPRGTKGFLIAKPPIPPGCLLTIWGDDAKFVETYWKNYPGMLLYHSGDFAIEDKDGYFFMLGRADEVINVAGHRLGTREVEEVINSHPKVAEVSAIGVKDEIKGEAIAAFVVVKEGVVTDDALRKEILAVVRDKIGAVALPRDLEFVKMLPKTRSGKVMRRVLKAICEGAKLGDLSTIEDGASLDEIKRAVMGSGLKVKE